MIPIIVPRNLAGIVMLIGIGLTVYYCSGQRQQSSAPPPASYDHYSIGDCASASGDPILSLLSPADCNSSQANRIVVKVIDLSSLPTDDEAFVEAECPLMTTHYASPSTDAFGSGDHQFLCLADRR